MNKTTNQYINALHLDPKKEAAVRKIIENAGGVNDSTPIVDTISGNELIPVNQNGENKAVRADELIKGGKEVFIVTPDMFVEPAATAGQAPLLTFTDEAWSDFIGAVETNKLIVLDIAVASYIISNSTPYGAPTMKGYFVLSYVTHVVDIVQGYFNVDIGEGIISYNIQIINKSITSTMKSSSDSSSEPYIWDGTTSETIFNELKSAIEDNKFIIYNSIMLIGFDNNDFLLLESLLPFNNMFFYINSEYIKEIPADNMFIKSSSTMLYTSSYSYYNIEEDTTFDIVSGDDLGEELPIINEYNGEFSFGDTVYTVTFPEEIKWSTDSVLEYKPNHTYQFKILNNLGVMKEFANA